MKKILLALVLLLCILKTEAQSSVFKVVDKLLLEGDYQEALVILNNQEPTIKILDKTAGIYQTIGNYTKAIEFYSKALQIEETEALKVKLGNVYNSAGLSSKTIGIYEDIVEKDSTNLLVLHNLGKLYLSHSKPKKAERIYRYLTSKDSLNPNFSYQLAKALAIQRKALETGQHYLNAFNKDTLHLKSIYELAKFYKKLKFKDSTELFIDKGLKIDSLNRNFLQLKSNNLYFDKQFDKALIYLKKLDSLNYKSINTYEMFGMCYFNLKELDSAKVYFNKALKIERDNSKILYRLGTIHYEEKDFKRAQLYLMMSITYGKGDLDKQYLLSGIMAKEELDLKLAIKHFEKAVGYNRNNVEALFQLAFTSDSYYKDKKIALRLYQRFIQYFESKSPKLTEYANTRIKEIKKEYFIKGEIVE